MFPYKESSRYHHTLNFLPLIFLEFIVYFFFMLISSISRFFLFFFHVMNINILISLLFQPSLLMSKFHTNIDLKLVWLLPNKNKSQRHVTVLYHKMKPIKWEIVRREEWGTMKQEIVKIKYKILKS